MRTKVVRRWLGAALVTLTLIALALVALSTGPASATRVGAPAGVSATGGATSHSNCPKGAPVNATCVTIPANCPKGKHCPTVMAQPTSGLALSQAVYLSMAGFANQNDSLYLQYCQDRKPLSVAPPMCVRTPIGELPEPQVVLKPFPNGTSAYAFQVLYLAKGSTPFQGVLPGTKKFGSFFCDAADPCSIDVTDPYLGPNGSSNALTPTAQNSAVIPVSFAAAQAGCPRASFINTESEFGIDSLLGAAASSSCTGAHPVADINVDLDAPSAVSAFVQQSMPLVFTDSPEAPAEQAALASVKGQYAFIPVALSANVVAFQAIAQGQQGYPDSSFAVTPNMAAGLVTNFYSTPSNSDIATCRWASGGTCFLLYSLNSVNGFEPPQEYGGYVRGDSSTPTYAFFQWVCSAPRVPVKLLGHKVLEPDTAAQVLRLAYSLNGLKAPKTCPADTDIFPTFTKNTPNFQTASTPAEQVAKLQSFVPAPQISTQTPHAGFAPMSWPDARQYGLSVAALQNASGRFVLPSTASLEAAASVMHEDSSGLWQPDYATTDSAAYPMPDVWYALVSTKAQSSLVVTGERNLVDDLLAVSGGSKTSDLPIGYAPLPAAMYKAALADVTKDIHVSTTPAGPPVVPPTTVPPTTTTTTTTAPPTTTTTPKSGGPPKGRPKGPQPVSTVLPKELASFTLVGRSDAWLPILFVCLIGVAAAFGPAAIAFARRRKVTRSGRT